MKRNNMENSDYKETFFNIPVKYKGDVVGSCNATYDGSEIKTSDIAIDDYNIARKLLCTSKPMSIRSRGYVINDHAVRERIDEIIIFDVVNDDIEDDDEDIRI